MNTLAMSMVFLLCPGAANVSGGAVSIVPRTTPPIVYVIDYSDRHFVEPEYLDRFRAAPPELLHVGKAVPITHLWGPVRLLKGENQYTGGPGHTLSWEAIALLDPGALAQRIELIRKTLDRYHAAGIREITPYISYHTLAGDHEKRLGFWKFYDQWGKYTRWAGPRPEHDPFDWLVVDRRGRFVGGSCGGYSPAYFAPLHRYRACINHPDWAEWHRRLIRMVAEVGYDGCFVDNTHPDDCYCRYCKAWFREFLEKNRELPWVERMTAGLDRDKLRLDSPDVPAELVRRARLLRTSDHLGMLREVGRRVKPRFTIFPNGNAIRECLTTGAQCDRNMFESTYSPGLMAVDEAPEVDALAITVTAGATKPKPLTHRYELSDPRTFMELKADLTIPTRVRVGQAADLKVNVLRVGASPEDGDWAEGFHLVLRDVKSDRQVRVDLEPGGALGGSSLRKKSRGGPVQPPALLHGVWTAERPGTYAVYFGFRYTDESHRNQTSDRPHLARIELGRLCRTHVATLMYAQHMRAKSIFLGYETRRRGWEHVAELAVAEMAAFSGGGGYAASGAVLAKYRAFFKKHADLFDGWRQTAPEAVLFAYWGSNPLNYLRPVRRSTLHDRLESTQRPFVALVDATLPEAAEALAGFRAIYLEADEYEMKTGQLAALRAYVRGGGRLVLSNASITINGQPAREVLGLDEGESLSKQGTGQVVLWNRSDPIDATEPICAGEGRGRNLRFALYRQGDRLALHVVNYNVCLLDKAKRVLEVDPTPLRIPVPAGWTGATATCFDPDLAQPQTIPVDVTEGVAALTLPEIRIYKVVVLSSRCFGTEQRPATSRRGAKATR